MSALADNGSHVSDAGFWWFFGGLCVLLAVRLGIHLWATRGQWCALCDVPLDSPAERAWGLCTRHRDAVNAALRDRP